MQPRWPSTVLIRRDYFGALGDYIPRGGPHFKQLLRNGCVHLSARSMQEPQSRGASGDAEPAATLDASASGMGRTRWQIECIAIAAAGEFKP